MRKLLIFIFSLIFCNLYPQKNYVITDSNGNILKEQTSGKIYYQKLDDNNWEYTPNSEWIPINNVVNNEIWILATDEGDRYSSFVCTVANSGTYNMDIYGGIDGKELISTYGVTASGTQINFQIPSGTGKPCSEGYHTYKIRIYANNSANSIIKFAVTKHNSTTITYNRWKMINFGTTSITSINCFMYNGTSTCPALKYVNTWHCSLISEEYYFGDCTALENITMARRMNYVLYLGTNPIPTNSYASKGSFYNCTSLKELVLPEEMNSLIILGPNTNYTNTASYGLCCNCTSLQSVTMPKKLNSCLALGCYNSTFHYSYGAFNNCTSLKSFVFPKEMNSLLALGCYSTSGAYSYGVFANCTSLQSVTLPDSLPSLLYYGGSSQSVIDGGAFTGCVNLVTINGGIYMPSLIGASCAINNCRALISLPICNTYSTNSIPYISVIRAMTVFNQPTMRCSSLILAGTSASVRSNLNTINIDWANSVFSGTNPQIDIRYNALSAATINAIFTALPDYSGSGVTHTINVASNVGSATCTPAIATAKGWTVITL